MTPPDPTSFIAQGASAEVFALEGERVLKLFHAGIDPGMVAREFAIARAVEATGLLMPRAIEQTQASGRLAIIYSRVSGPTLFDHVRGRPHRMLWALRAMADLQQAVQAKAVPTLRSRKSVLAEDIEASDLGRGLREAALDRLDQLVEGDALSHGDLHPGNVIVTQGGLVLIDWSKAARAASAADIVRSEMLLRFGPGSRESGIASAMRDAGAAYYQRACLRASGLDAAALGAWRGLVALAWSRHRFSGRDSAFAAYLEQALKDAGLPSPGA
jgi:aminoglycoside phosphotransferase (APT) family kinase protein